ncbi:MAG: hypothetical protein Ct9H90mP7_4990 [Candidatus Neomarinimicrobiota bacterium]|nr:MAG: hypothetical protein Ct9H90mP7_4990 [Candidatus Neomarinimicrobiota bacterium]
MEEDDGKDFFMVNFLDYNESPKQCQQLAKELLFKSYELLHGIMYPEMFKRASHPIFFSEVFFPAMDIVRQKMEEWDNVAFVR